MAKATAGPRAREKRRSRCSQALLVVSLALPPI